jgi:mono/diheme cytochrome c family protein
VFTSIADGRERNGIRMPEWRGALSDKQIWETTAYVLSISQPSNKP